MPVSIHRIVTRVPEHVYPQSYVRDLMKDRIGTRRETSAILHRLYSQSGIDKRHSVLPDLLPGSEYGFLFGSGEWNPTTGTRNAVYTREARTLFSRVAAEAIDAGPFARDEITHVITVSCTGFYAPGPDYTILTDLGLPLGTPRFHVGFMGCYAVFPALRMAQAFCQADPGAVVLIVSVELCTLHLRFSESLDAMLGAAVFADGAAAALVSARPSDGATLRLNVLQTSLAPEGEADMAWTIGDHGFEMVLSSYVPKILEMKADATVRPLLERAGLEKRDVDLWAVHPGGRAILDKVRDSVGIDESKLAASRDVLRQYGNLSSAAILFVLEQIMTDALGDLSMNVVAMAFGPGLTIESAALTLVPATVPMVA